MCNLPSTTLFETLQCSLSLTFSFHNISSLTLVPKAGWLLFALLALALFFKSQLFRHVFWYLFCIICFYSNTTCISFKLDYFWNMDQNEKHWKKKILVVNTRSLNILKKIKNMKISMALNWVLVSRLWIYYWIQRIQWRGKSILYNELD